MEHAFEPGRFKHAALGSIAWVVAVTVLRPGLAEGLLLLGPLVAVPLGLRLAAPLSRAGVLRGPWRLALSLALPAALALALSFAFPPGAAASALALPWLAVTLCCAALGVVRLVERGGGPPEEVAVDAAHLFLAVGGVWTVASRGGVPVLGFHEPWVLLTAAHFHFAGFALPLLTGLAGRARPDRAARACAFGVITGVPLVAIGITLGARGLGAVELLAALWLAFAGLGVAWLHLRQARRARVLGIAGLCLAVGMAMVLVYAAGAFTGRAWLDLRDMERAHATLNVLGFALPALVYWTAVGAPKVRSAGFQLLVPALGDRPDLDDWEARDFAAGVADGPAPGDARDAHEEDAGVDAAGVPPVADGPHRRAAAAILGFEVFPARLAAPRIRRSPVEVGDTLVLVYHLLPGIDAVIGARVTTVFDGGTDGARGEVWRTGFTYRTLEGHPFVGEEDFVVETDMRTGRVRVALRSWSRPAGPVVKLLSPIVRRLQLGGGRAAARHLAAIARAGAGGD